MAVWMLFALDVGSRRGAGMLVLRRQRIGDREHDSGCTCRTAAPHDRAT
jgi:hypothetical protein